MSPPYKPACLITCLFYWIRLNRCLDVPVAFTGHERKLFMNVTSGYNSISRPVRSAGDQVRLTFGLSLNQILDLDGKHQILTSYVWIYQKWRDENLNWNPADFNGIQKIMFPSPIIWVPDLYIFNVAGSSLDGFVNNSGSNVVVKYDGSVEWSVPIHIKSACPVDATYFPYDKQTCYIRFGSWIYDLTQIDIVLDGNRPDLSNYVVNNEFDIASIMLHTYLDSSNCCPGGEKHPMVSFEIRLKRKTIYYDYIVIAPTINLCVLTLATFLLPCECGWKIAIGLTVFLTLYVLQLLIAENVPDTNSTPLISVFLLLVMSLNCVSLITATVVMNIKRRTQDDPVPKVPPWLLHVCEHYLSRITCTRISDWKKIATIPKETTDVITDMFARAREDDVSFYESVRRSLSCEPPSRPRDQYVQLSNMSPAGYGQRRDPDKPDGDDGGKQEKLGRCMTAESTFSTVSCADGFTKEADYTDQLIDNHKDCKSNLKNSSSENPLCSIDDEIPGKSSNNVPKNENISLQISNADEYRAVRNRPSYRRAVGTHPGTGYYTALTKVPRVRPRRREIPRRVRFKNKLKRNDSFFSGISKKYQWYFVADVIDTVFFVFYVVIMFVGILTVLVIVPNFA